MTSHGITTICNFLGRRRRSLSACRDEILLLLPALAYMFQLFRLRDEVESKKKMKRRQKRMREKMERDKEKNEQEQEQAMEGAKDAQGKLLSVRTNSNCSLMHHSFQQVYRFHPLKCIELSVAVTCVFL